LSAEIKGELHTLASAILKIDKLIPESLKEN